MSDKKKSKKMRIAASLIGLVVVAAVFIGVAYATTYQGTMVDQSNDVNTTYITIVKDGVSPVYNNSFDKDVLYNTSNVSGTITYTLETTQGGYSATLGNQLSENAEDKVTVPTVLIGTITVVITETDSNDPYVFSITHDAAITGTYYVGINIDAGGMKYYSFSSAADGGYTTASLSAAASRTIVVNLYLTVGAGTTVAPPANPVDNVTFTFKALATSTPAA